MATFVLFQDPWHVTLCWERVTPDPERQEHWLIVPDLRFDNAGSTIEPLVTDVKPAIADPRGMILVSNSASRIVDPVVAGQRPMREVTFVASMLQDLRSRQIVPLRLVVCMQHRMLACDRIGQTVDRFEISLVQLVSSHSLIWSHSALARS